MLNFIKGIFDTAVEADDETSTEVAHATASLDIQRAISVHEDWKARLQAYLDGTSEEQLIPKVVCLDHRCDLGRWIYRKGKANLGGHPGFSALMAHHKMFHHAAAKVIDLSKSGKSDQAQAMLAGPLSHFSRDVVKDLNALDEVAQSARKPKTTLMALLR